MAAGLAIVTTDVGVEGIEGIDGVHYSVAKSDEDFTIKTIELLGSPEKRALMGASAHALAKNHYDWDTVVQKIYHMHNELCGNQQA